MIKAGENRCLVLPLLLLVLLLLGSIGEATSQHKVKVLAMMYAAMKDGNLSEYLVSMSEQFADDLYAAYEDKQTVRIERYVPTIWQGTITIGRTINGSWDIGAGGNGG